MRLSSSLTIEYLSEDALLNIRMSLEAEIAMWMWRDVV